MSLYDEFITALQSSQETTVSLAKKLAEIRDTGDGDMFQRAISNMETLRGEVFTATVKATAAYY